MLDSLLETLEHAHMHRPAEPRATIALELGSSPGRLDAVLRLRAAHPDVRLLMPAEESRSDGIVDAFRRGAEAYIVGSGDVGADLALIDEIVGGRPCYAPTRAV